MKNAIKLTSLIVLVFIIGLYAGFKICGSKIQRFHKELSTKEYAFDGGVVELIHYVEGDNLAFVQTDSSMVRLKIEGNQGIVLYSANRVFQEKYYYVQGLEIKENQINWTDGVRHYSLKVVQKGM